MLLVGGTWTLRLWVRKAVGCFQQSLMAQASSSMEEGGTESCVDYNSLVKSISEEKKYR